MQHIDKLDREEAFFPGPPPLLLTSFTANDLAILLGGSDKASSQVSTCYFCTITYRDSCQILLLVCYLLFCTGYHLSI